MKKVKLICVLILIVLTLVGCSISPKESIDIISTPNNKKIPISGTWEVVGAFENDSSKDSTIYEEWKNKTVEFSEEFMVLADYYLNNPRYQIKLVNGREYLLYNHKSFLKEFNIPDEEMEVITVIDKDKYFCEIVIISDSELILSASNYSLHLKKVSDEVSSSFQYQDMQKKSDVNNLLMSENDFTCSGILLGLRSDNSDEYSYRTLWIGFKDRVISSVIETEGIIFPRRSGFWKMEFFTSEADEKTEDHLYAFNISKENPQESRKAPFLDFSDWDGRTGKIQKRIDYIGNDYVSIEVIGRGGYEYSNKSWQENILQILPIDSLPSNKNIKITDLSRDESLGVIELGIQKTMQKLNIKEENLINKYKLLDSFGLTRKMGHWFFKGRINYLIDDEFHYADYSINIIPPSKLVIYDDLKISWTYIKDKVPEAIDAFTSPLEDIAVVVTKNEIIIYEIVSGEMENTPLKKINLKDNEAVIMAEWATGDYVDNWSKALSEFSNNE